MKLLPALGLLAALTLAAPAAHAQTAKSATLQPPLAGLGFLVGEWSSGQGQVADTGETSTGRSIVTIEAGGGALLRRDHTDLTDKAGKPKGGFEQIMLIYPEGGTLHGEYSDGSHVIHYISAVVEAGKSVTFPSGGPGPVFKLAYNLKAPKTLGVNFSIQPPGAPGFQPIATGTLVRK